MKLRPPVLRRLAFTAGAAILALAPTAVLAADAPPPSKVLSRYETAAAGNVVSRDCGYSTKAPNTTNQALWIFCDSAWSGTSSGFWLGVTAAIGSYTPGQVPTTLTEIPTPTAPINAPSNRPPSGLLPVPSGLVLPNGANCQVPGSSYPASWASGVAQQPSGSAKVLLPYADVCVHGGGITTERFGLVEYNPSTNTLSGQKQVFSSTSQLPFQKILGSPIFSGGYLYLFGYICDSQAFGACGSGRVTLARVSATASSWGTGSNYRYWTGSAWSADHNAATSILPGAKPLAVHAEDFGALGKGFVIVEQIDIGGNFRIWRSNSLTGGWSVTRTGTAPCGDQQGLDLCRAYFGHPALSTSSNLLMSYYDPANDHVNVMAVPW
ncbi:hypothetical protein [Actinomadura rudentiformis]|uniref:DUF4185 domain-containing protein n=1 Tax=Actinomadura rudentiformis TaxID=359158 RepID=A0A6H9YPX7_9ACTN|nr:hypothetical protein [Actinomadura rudentiformis]KAB2348407.1 hypothetical protein F8566_16605 [Actinomadura rudentiformis]